MSLLLYIRIELKMETEPDNKVLENDQLLFELTIYNSKYDKLTGLKHKWLYIKTPKIHTYHKDVYDLIKIIDVIKQDNITLLKYEYSDDKKNYDNDEDYNNKTNKKKDLVLSSEDRNMEVIYMMKEEPYKELFQKNYEKEQKNRIKQPSLFSNTYSNASKLVRNLFSRKIDIKNGKTYKLTYIPDNPPKDNSKNTAQELIIGPVSEKEEILEDLSNSTGSSDPIYTIKATNVLIKKNSSIEQFTGYTHDTKTYITIGPNYKLGNNVVSLKIDKFPLELNDHYTIEEINPKSKGGRRSRRRAKKRKSRRGKSRR